MTAEEPLLSIEDLNVSFRTTKGLVKANEGIRLEIREGEVLALIGETGCGKTTLGKALLRLLSKKAKIEGRVIYRGRDLLALPEKEMRQVRGKEIGIMLQNPSACLNPVLSVGKQIAEIYRCHEGCGKKEAKRKAAEMLSLVGLDPSRGCEYPHQFSGGMLQRVMVAIGLALRPGLLVADEPTKGLDPEAKYRIADLIVGLIRQENSALLLITHDLELAGRVADRLAVMYAGEIVETGKAETVLSAPKHPYTRALLCSLPEKGLCTVAGQAPGLVSPPPGCRYHPRCSSRIEACSQIRPELLCPGGGGLVRCLLYERGQAGSAGVRESAGTGTCVFSGAFAGSKAGEYVSLSEGINACEYAGSGTCPDAAVCTGSGTCPDAAVCTGSGAYAIVSVDPTSAKDPVFKQGGAET